MEVFTVTLNEFSEKYCLRCGSQRCCGVTDEPFRDGCAYYQREILKQPILQDILSSLPRQPKYNPVEKAYDVLYNVFSNKNAGWDDASLAIEEAIGFLGEALAK